MVSISALKDGNLTHWDPSFCCETETFLGKVSVDVSDDIGDAGKSHIGDRAPYPNCPYTLCF